MKSVCLECRSRIQLASVVVLAVVLILTPITTASATVIEVPQRSGSPGETIEFVGHDWLTCCPQGVPSDPVVIYFMVGDERLLLFEGVADDDGEVVGSFRVPNVGPGRFDLEACGGDPQENVACFPQGIFTVLAAQLPSTGLEHQHFRTAVLLILSGCILMGTSSISYRSSP